MVAAFLIVSTVGLADYFSGYQTSWSIFYLVAIAFAVWNVGMWFAIVIATFSIASWLIGDWAAGVIYPNRFVPIWNALITFSFYLVVIWLLSRLKTFNRRLETQIRERTADLQMEISAREQLEKEVAEVTEKERRRIGHELHDTICQHLTATSLSIQVLSGKLSAQSLPQTKDADRSVQLVEEAIDLTRGLAKGLFPLELEGEGLSGALLELCQSTAGKHRIRCDFNNRSQAPAIDSSTATHLYRIAQEAIANGIKHGHVSHISVDLFNDKRDLTLCVRDDGIGLPDKLSANRGLGLRIMASRAGMIGAAFSVANDAAGGVSVTCHLSLANQLNSKTV